MASAHRWTSSKNSRVLSGDERPFGKRGDAHDEIAEVLGFADDLDRSRLLDEVDLHHGFAAFAPERLDAACFTRLASASDERP